MIIRQVTPQDYEGVYFLIQKAFKTAAVSDGTEQDFALRLRKSQSYVSELDLVLEDKDELIGHVMLTKRELSTANGTMDVLMLAPLSVKLENRNQGFGGQIVKDALDRARALGFKAVFLCGNPEYYKKFGFALANSFNIEYKGTFLPEFVQCIELCEGALTVEKGQITLE